MLQIYKSILQKHLQPVVRDVIYGRGDVFKMCSIMNEGDSRGLDAGKRERGSVTMATSGGGSGGQNCLGACHSHKIKLKKERNRLEGEMTKVWSKNLKNLEIKEKIRVRYKGTAFAWGVTAAKINGIRKEHSFHTGVDIRDGNVNE
jgi:hypothetical protein